MGGLTSRNINGRTSFAGISLMLSMGSVPALGAMLEEVMVTAQKREESLQDVPIAISAVTGAAMRSEGITNMQSLAPSVPSFYFSEAVSGSDNMFMRGIGSGPNYGFEQAVGQVLDGFFFGRSRFGRATFLDLERVEILKGPQGALIGKNTSGGAVSITTAKPTEEFEAWLSGQYEFEANEGYTTEGAVSGPLTESLRGRMAYRVDDRDGWVDNVVLGDDQPTKDDSTIRAILDWDLTDDMVATFTYQYGDAKRKGRSRQLSLCGEALRALPLFNTIVAEGEDCKANYSRNVVNTQYGEGNYERIDTSFDIAGITVNWDLEDFTITSLTGYAKYTTKDLLDVDATYAEIAGMKATEDYEQWSQELRIASAGGGELDYIAGLYFQGTDQTTDFRRDFAYLPGENTIGSNTILTKQDGTSSAIFGQVTWNILDNIGLTLGGRYTVEDKHVKQNQFSSALYTTDPETLNPVLTPGPGTPNPAAPQHYIERHRSENNFSPDFVVTWHPDDETLVYGSIRTGFKGGGFDHQYSAPQQAENPGFEYKEEKVTAYEVGLKMTFADGAAQINTAVFRSEYDDLQVSALNSTDTTFEVGNAASAISQGVEVDGKWAVTDRLLLTFAGSYLDAEYDKYDNGPCNTNQLLTSTCPNPELQVQDLSGKSLQYAPKYAASTSVEYVWALPDSLELTGFLQLTYSDEFYLSLDLDPNLVQDAYTKLNARLSVAPENGAWEVAVVGRNLTDERTSGFGNDALGGGFMAGSYFKMVDPPRAVAIQGKLSF